MIQISKMFIWVRIEIKSIFYFEIDMILNVKFPNMIFNHFKFHFTIYLDSNFKLCRQDLC